MVVLLIKDFCLNFGVNKIAARASASSPCFVLCSNKLNVCVCVCVCYCPHIDFFFAAHMNSITSLHLTDTHTATPRLHLFVFVPPSK